MTVDELVEKNWSGDTPAARENAEKVIQAINENLDAVENMREVIKDRNESERHKTSRL